MSNRSARFDAKSEEIQVLEHVPKVKWPKCLRESFDPLRTPGEDVVHNFGPHGVIERLERLDEDERTAAATMYTWDELQTPKGPKKIYEQVNTSLRLQSQSKWVNFIHHLNAFIQNADDVNADALYRGIDKDFGAGLTKGSYVFFCEFTSTSTRKAVASFFRGNGWLLRFASWGPAASLEEYSQFPTEKEVLLSPYQSFRVDRIDHDKRTVTLVHVDSLRWE